MTFICCRLIENIINMIHLSIPLFYSAVYISVCLLFPSKSTFFLSFDQMRIILFRLQKRPVIQSEWCHSETNRGHVNNHRHSIEAKGQFCCNTDFGQFHHHSLLMAEIYQGQLHDHQLHRSWKVCLFMIRAWMHFNV